MAATWAARCGINARIVDKRGTKVFKGQADGLQARTLEIFDSFGFVDRVLKESNHLWAGPMLHAGLRLTLKRQARDMLLGSSVSSAGRWRHQSLKPDRTLTVMA